MPAQFLEQEGKNFAHYATTIGLHLRIKQDLHENILTKHRSPYAMLWYLALQLAVELFSKSITECCSITKVRMIAKVSLSRYYDYLRKNYILLG